MPRESSSPHASLIAQQPIPQGADAFSERMQGLMDGRPKDEATVAQALQGQDEMIGKIAAGLYSLASMLVGEGEDGVRLVETTIATTEVSVCHDLLEARRSCRRALACAALEMLAGRDASSLTAPHGVAPAGNCIEDDDLEAAGVSREELERMIAGPDRDRVRQWLAKLPVSLRIVFVLRAVAGFTAAETAALLIGHGGPTAAGWNTEAVRQVFRQGLCSLASQLIQASAKGSS